jgi:hypothetical protein
MTTTPTARTAVRFTGLAGATAPMTWSQYGMWEGGIKKFRPYDTYLNVSFRVAVPPGRSLDDVLSVLRDVVTRHEGLRSRYYDAADGTGTQEVAGSGEVEVLLRDDPAGGTEESLDGLLRELADHSFDFDVELAARFAVVRLDGRPAWLLAVVSHLSIDGLARNRLHEEFTARLAGDDRYGADEPVLTPVARAREEDSPAGEQLNTRSLRRWRRFVESTDVANFTTRLAGDPGDPVPRWVRTSMLSPALGAAFDVVAERDQVTSPAVYVALSATAVSVLSGRATSALRCMISNRFTGPEKRYIGNLSQACAFAVEVGDAPFDEVVRRAMAASIRGYSMGRYRTEELAAIVDTRRFDAMHNDFRDTAASARPERLLTEPEIRALRSRTTLGRPQSLDYYDDKFHVEVRRGDGGPAPAVMIDRCYLPFTQPREILLAMESFALAVLSTGRDLPAAEVFKRALSDAADGDQHDNPEVSR